MQRHHSQQKLVISQPTEHILFTLFYCCADFPPALSKVIGVVGVSSNKIAAAVCKMLSLARVPVISYLATSDDLSLKDKFPYFLRMIPPERCHSSLLLIN